MVYLVGMCKHNSFLSTVGNNFSRKKPLLRDGKNIRENFSKTKQKSKVTHDNTNPVSRAKNV